MHLFFEISLERIFGMPDSEFLDLCSLYLVEALAEQEARWVDQEARQYGRSIGMDYPYGYDAYGDVI